MFIECLLYGDSVQGTGGQKVKGKRPWLQKTLAFHKFDNYLYLVPRLCSRNPKSYTDHLCLEVL